MDFFNNMTNFLTGQSAFGSLTTEDIASSERGSAHRQSIQEHKAAIVAIKSHVKELEDQLTNEKKALATAKRRLAGVEETANTWAERRIQKRKKAKEEAKSRKVLLDEGAKNAIAERRRQHGDGGGGTLKGGRRTRRRRRKKRRRRTRQKRHQRGCKR